MKRSALAALSIAALTLAACSGGGGEAASPTPTETLTQEATAAPTNPELTVVDEPIFEATGDKGTAPELSFSGDAPADLQRYTLDANPDGVTVGADDVVLANYHGQVWNGDVFDSSYERGAPIAFSLNSVIPGWKHGLAGAHVGERVELSIPSELGYPQGTPDGSIKPGDPIVFVVEILDTVAPDTQAPAAGESVADPADHSMTVEETDGSLSGVTLDDDAEAPAQPELVKLSEGTGDKPITAESQFVVRAVADGYEADSPSSEAQLVVTSGQALPDAVGASAGARFALKSPQSQNGPAQVLVFDVIKVF